MIWFLKVENGRNQSHLECSMSNRRSELVRHRQLDAVDAVAVVVVNQFMNTEKVSVHNKLLRDTT